MTRLAKAQRAYRWKMFWWALRSGTTINPLRAYRIACGNGFFVTPYDREPPTERQLKRRERHREYRRVNDLHETPRIDILREDE